VIALKIDSAVAVYVIAFIIEKLTTILF